MSRVGLFAAVGALMLGAFTAAPATAAEPPSCQIRYSVNDELQLRDSKQFDIPVDCGWWAQDFTVSVSDQAQHGTVGPASWDADLHEHVITYDPVDDYVGTDQFTLSISDGTDVASVVVKIRLESNTAPSCGQHLERTYSHTRVASQHTQSINCGDWDLQDMELEPELFVGPEHGTVELSTGSDFTGPLLSVTYTPDPGFIGSDSLVAGVSDGELSAQVEFRFNVADGPWCTPFERYEIRAGKTGTFGAFCTQPDGAPGPLRVRVIGGPDQGTATPDAYTGIEYVPFPAASGLDSFSYEAYSPAGVSNVVSQEWTILPNAAPACEGISTTTPTDSSVGASLSCSDADEDPVTMAVATGPEHGALSEIADGQVTYTPDPGFIGVDRFVYVGSDYARTSAPATVRITVDDGKPPVLGLGIARGQSPREVARRGLHLSAASDEMVSGRLQVSVSGRTAKRLGLVRRADGPVLIGSARDPYEGGVPAMVRLALRPRAATALRPAHRVPITVRLRGVDPLGNVAQVTRRVTLRR